MLPRILRRGFFAEIRELVIILPLQPTQHQERYIRVSEVKAVPADLLEQPCWYALHTRSRHEKVVRDQLGAKGITNLLPLWHKRSVWKDRIKMVEVPLFSGYIFGHFPLKHKLEVLQTVGIVRIVGLNGYPLPVPNEQIEAVQTMIEQHLHYDPHPFLQEGMRVRVKRGLLRGAEGILVAKKQHYRLVISVDLIQKSVAVDIDSADVEPMDW
jgi:transcription antitermination factor NusG